MQHLIKLSPVHHEAEKWQGQFFDQDGWQVMQWFSTVEHETAVALNSLALCDQSHRRKFRIEGQAAGVILPADDMAINAGKTTTHGTLYRLRPDLFFLLTGSADEVAAADLLTAVTLGIESLTTVTDVTHGYAELWLVGPKSPELLSRLCSLDFHDSRFPNYTAKQSSVAKTNQIIIRQDQSNLLAYALIGARSLAGYLWQTLFTAGEDFGLGLMGQKAFAKLAEEN